MGSRVWVSRTFFSTYPEIYKYHVTGIIEPYHEVLFPICAKFVDFIKVCMEEKQADHMWLINNLIEMGIASVL